MSEIIKMCFEQRVLTERKGQNKKKEDVIAPTVNSDF